MPNRYFRGQGSLYVSSRDTDGNPGSYRNVGNVPELMIDIAQASTEHTESQTGQRRVDLKINTTTSVTASITLESIDKQNWALALQASYKDIAGASHSLETHDSGDIGEAFALDFKNITSVASLATGGTTYVLGTDYSMRLPSNMITVLSAGMANKVITCSYVSGDVEEIGAFNAQDTDLYFYFDGLNTVEDRKPVVIELFKVSLERTTQLSLIGDDIVKMTIKGTCLYDPLYDTGDSGDKDVGGFFKVTQSAPA